MRLWCICSPNATTSTQLVQLQPSLHHITPNFSTSSIDTHLIMATPRLILPVAPPSFTTSSAPSAAVSYIPPPVHGPTISKPMSYIPPPVHGPTIVKPPAYRLPTPSSPSNNATAQSSQQSTFIPTSPASIGSPVNLGFIPRPVYGAPVSMPSQAPVQQVFNPQSTNMVFQSIVNGQTRFIPTPMGAPNATMYNQGISQGILQPVPQVNYVQTLQPQKPLPNQPIPRMAACGKSCTPSFCLIE